MIGFLIRIVAAEAVGAAFDHKLRERRQRERFQDQQAFRTGVPPLPRPPSSQVLFVIAGLVGFPMIALGVLGILLAVPAAIDAVQGTGDWRVAANLSINCTLLGVLPGFAAILLGGFFGLRRRRMERLVALAETHGRLPLALLATELAIPEADARQLLLAAVEGRYVRGRFDLVHGVFLSSVADSAPRQWAGRCPTCSAQVSVVLAAGEPGICSYCRAALPT